VGVGKARRQKERGSKPIKGGSEDLEVLANRGLGGREGARTMGGQAHPLTRFLAACERNGGSSSVLKEPKWDRIPVKRKLLHGRGARN